MFKTDVEVGIWHQLVSSETSLSDLQDGVIGSFGVSCMLTPSN